jgi:DNA repair protein RecO (recombination protein O)
MVNKYQERGIVIKRKNIGEIDKLITLYTKNHGKIIAIAKGIRKIHSRRASHLELFNSVEIILFKGKTFDTIVEATAIDTSEKIRTSINKIAYLYRVSEILDKLSAEFEQSLTIYCLFEELLRNIKNSAALRESELDYFSEKFVNNLLRELGFIELNKELKGEVLYNYVEEIIERQLKSRKLLTKI